MNREESSCIPFELRATHQFTSLAIKMLAGESAAVGQTLVTNSQPYFHGTVSALAKGLAALIIILLLGNIT